MILVLGATGPAGICLLRELISSNYHIIVYARNPAKIPTDIASQELLTVSYRVTFFD
jgi:putative NADH-flavin reductase